MTAFLMPLARQRFWNNDGTLAAGCFLYLFEAGTNVPKVAYRDAAGTDPHPHPIVLDAKGEALIYGAGAYKQNLTTAAGAQVTGYPVDNVVVPLTASDVAAPAGAGMIGFSYAAAYAVGSLGRWLQDLALAAGSSFIGFIQAGAGAVLMSLQTKLRQSVHIKDFGVTGVGDELAKVQAFLNASLYCNFGGIEHACSVSGALTLRDGHVLFGTGGGVTQLLANTEIFNMENKTGIKASGLSLVGIPTYTDSDSSRSVGFYGGTSGARNQIRRCKFYNFGYTPARFHGQSDCSFTYNTVEGPGAATLTPVTSGRNYGVLFDAGCVGALIHGNNISKTAQGARIEGTRDCRVTANRFYDIVGQHGVYAGSGLRNLVIANNTVDNVDLIGIKVQAADAALVDNINIVIAGNTVYDCGDQGILVCNGTAGGTYKCRGVSITGNVVRLTTGSGINLNNTISGVVSGNTVDLAGFSGVNISEASSLKIDANIITRSGLSGIRDGVACSDIAITSNKIRDCATLVDLFDRHGIYIVAPTSSEYDISNNDIGDSNAKMRYGIFLSGGVMGSFTVNDNVVTQATDCGLRLGSTAAMRSYEGNCWAGTIAATFNDPVPPSVASAATIILPTDHAVVTVTGAAAVTTIVPNGHSGRIVTLLLAAGVTITDGANLNVAGNFVATANDTITLACDGINWNEVARSLN